MTKDQKIENKKISTEDSKDKTVKKSSYIKKKRVKKIFQMV